jgi:hypothetical protein
MTPSLHRVASVDFPCFVGTMSHYDFSAFFPADFVLLRLTGTVFSHVVFVSPSLAPPGCMHALGPGSFISRTPRAAFLKDRNAEISHVPRLPFLICPVLGPRRNLAIRHCDSLVLLPLFAKRKLPHCSFRGSIARLLRSLSTLHNPRSPSGPCKTRFRLLATLCRMGFSPIG